MPIVHCEKVQRTSKSYDCFVSMLYYENMPGCATVNFKSVGVDLTFKTQINAMNKIELWVNKVDFSRCVIHTVWFSNSTNLKLEFIFTDFKIKYIGPVDEEYNLCRNTTLPFND